MKVELLYFGCESNPKLESELAVFGPLAVHSVADRRAYLTALASSLIETPVVLTLGDLDTVAESLSRGLSLPLAAIDWQALGFPAVDDVTLPKGALPLLVDGSVYGFLLESGPQAILVIDSDAEAVEILFSTYLSPYLSARINPPTVNQPQPTEEAPVEEIPVEEAPAEDVTVEEIPTEEIPAEEAPTEEIPAEDIPAEEAIASADDVAEPENEPEAMPMAEDEPMAFEEDTDETASVADDYFVPQDMEEAPEEYDVFTDAPEYGEREAETPKKRHWLWIPLVAVALALLIAAGGCWYVFLRDGGADGYYASLMKNVYGDVGDVKTLDDAFATKYLTRFGALYQQNDDIIATVTVKKLNINLPVVCAAGKTDYYRYRRFDGTYAAFGTPYVTSRYSETDVNPNLVIHGGSLFSSLNTLLKNGVNDVTLKTDSILYGEDEWTVVSVMVLDDKALATYDNTFATLKDTERKDRAVSALKQSKVKTAVTADDLENVDASTNFLTLLTPSTDDKSKTVAVFAVRLSTVESLVVAPVEETENGGVDLTGEALSSQETQPEE